MTRSVAMAVLRKEILDAIRDPRAVLYLVGLPLVFYPLLLLSLEFVAQRVLGATDGPPYPIYVTRIEEARLLAVALNDDPDLNVIPTTAPALAVLEGRCVLALEPAPGFDAETRAAGHPEVHMFVNVSSGALGPVRERVEAVLATLARHHGLERLDVVEATLEPDTDVQVMQGLFPYFLLVLILVGAGHLAIDLTAGEKERRTLETLLTTPAGRLAILAGKAGATLMASLSSGAFGLIGFAAAIAIADWFSPGSPRLLSLSARSYGVLAAGAVPSAFFLTAMLIALGTLARSSREGQTYAAYLQMPLLLTALIASYLAPGARSPFYLCPLLGVNLVQAEYMTGGGEPVEAVMAIGATLVAGVLLLLVSARLFAKESVLFRA